MNVLPVHVSFSSRWNTRVFFEELVCLGPRETATYLTSIVLIYYKNINTNKTLFDSSLYSPKHCDQYTYWKHCLCATVILIRWGLVTAMTTRRTELFVAHGEATSVTLALAANGTAPTTVAVPVLCHSACARPVPASHTAAFHWKHTREDTIIITYSTLCTLVDVLYWVYILSNKSTRRFACRKHSQPCILY
jgi:hypothetical protein